jgi:methionine sulfoxide reductase heme-binding subunit
VIAVASIARRALNGWPLFLTIAAMTFIAISAAALLIGISTPESTVNLIRLSVQLASPWIFLAFAASAMAQLFPGNISSWLLRNRRYLGLSFAAGFGWQAVFIAVLFTLYSPYYWEELHKTSDLVLRVASYALLVTMTITSFFPVRRRLRTEYWHWLQLVGVWYFWAAIWTSYAELAFSSSATVISFVYFNLGLLTLSLRVAAYLKRRTNGLEMSS